MTNLISIVSATIVAFFLSRAVGAAPIGVIVDPTPAKPVPRVLPQNENMVITEPGPLPEGALTKPLPDYFAFREALTFRLGQSAPLMESEDPELFVGFSYMFPAFLSPHFEFGADVHNQGDKGHIHASVRFSFLERRPLRPSVKIGLGHEVNAREALATFANYRHYFGRAGAALDASFAYNWSVRLEAEVFAGIEDYYLNPSLGLVRNW